MQSTNKILSPIYSRQPEFDNGWVQCNDWTDQQLGNTVGSNFVHNLNKPLYELDVTVIFSPIAGDVDSAVYHNVSTDGNPGGNNPVGFSISHVNNNELYIQTGGQGILRLNTATGATANIPAGWYYRLIARVRYGTVSVRDVSGDISTTAVDTVRNDSDGKRIYKREWTGTTGAGATSTLALGITIDRVTAPMIFKIDSSSFGWMGPEGSNNMSVYFTNTTQNDITMFHNAVHMQSRPYRLILEYTI